MELIYHYCSLETFVQIIKNKTIRLSDLDKTNDYMEKRWGMELLQEALKGELEDNCISMDLQENYWYSEDAHNHIEQLNHDIERYNRIAIETFDNIQDVDINDLYAVSISLPHEAHSDFVHFETDIGIKALGNQVLDCLRRNMK